MSHKASAVIHKDDSHSLSGSFYDANQISDSLKSTADSDESKFNFMFSHSATLLKHALISPHVVMLYDELVWKLHWCKKRPAAALCPV